MLQTVSVDCVSLGRTWVSVLSGTGSRYFHFRSRKQQHSPVWPALLQAKLTLLAQTHLTHHVFLTLNHLSGPVQDFLQFIHTYTLPACGGSSECLPWPPAYPPAS